MIESIGSQLPLWAVALAFAVLGAIWGSFAAALCQRWPRGEGVAFGRSRCDHCKQVLGATELVPVISYLYQKGHCRHCSGAIARSNLWTELACAALGLLCASWFSGWAVVAAAVYCWLLVPLIVLDGRHLWLPDRLVLLLGLAGLAIGGQLFAQLTIADQIAGGVAAFVALELIRQLYGKLRGVEAMGGGDPKLFGAIGLWAGWAALPIILLTASLIGLAHFAAMPRKWREAGRLQLPLGSYLGGAAILWLFVGADSIGLIVI